MLTCGQGIKLGIDPLLSQKDIIFISYESSESVGGSIPNIIVTVKTQKDPCQITDVMDCKIINENGWSIDFKAYVVKIEYINLNCRIYMYGCEPEFSRVNTTSSYVGINKAVKSTYRQFIDSNVDLGTVLPEVKLFQKNESNEEFLKRLLSSVSYGVIYAFGLGRLMVRDLKNWKEEFSFTRALDISPTTPQGVMNPKVHSNEVEILEEYTNHVKIKFNDTIIDVDKFHKDLVMNRLNNSKLQSPKSDFTFTVRYLPPVSLCSNVTINSKETKVYNCYVTSRILYFDYTEFKASYSVKSIDPE